MIKFGWTSRQMDEDMTHEDITKIAFVLDKQVQVDKMAAKSRKGKPPRKVVG